MSAIARLFFLLGFHNIIGIENEHNEITRALSKEGIPIAVGHGCYTVSPTDFVIYSATYLDSPQVQQSIAYIGTNHKKIFPPFTYYQFLGEMSKYFETRIVSDSQAQTKKAIEKNYPGYCLYLSSIEGSATPSIMVTEDGKDAARDILSHITIQKGPKIEYLMKKHLFLVTIQEEKRCFLDIKT